MPEPYPYRLTLAYDGGDFAGWQLQRARPARTVQGVLEDALSRLAGGDRVSVSGAGRTDAGVHALGQVASFWLARDWDAAALQRALNGVLPPDLRVLEAARAAEGFHARRSATGKQYRYELDLGSVQLPARRHCAALCSLPFDAARAAAVAALYLGRHDFSSLASSGGSVRTPERHVTRSDAWLENGPAGRQTLVYETEADGFLRKMVRSMVGGMIAAGTGASDVERLDRALRARDRRAWPAPAEARGLSLVWVSYPDSLR